MADKRKLLIVDDESSLCMFMKLNLERTGDFTVFTATNGEDGIAIAQAESPDLILLDVFMPSVSGPEVAQELKASPSTKDIPVLFLTGGVMGDDNIRENTGIAEEIEAAQFISKPIETKELISLINEMLL